MNKIIFVILISTFVFLRSALADDAVDKVQTGISVFGGILNKVQKSKENQQQPAQEEKGQTRAASEQSSNNGSVQSQEPEVNKEDILMLMKKIKTNLTEEQLTRSAECMISLGGYPYDKFGYFLFLVGEGQFSKQDKERILKKQVGDSGANWKSKISSITVDAATMIVETDMMTYSGNSMKPDKVNYIFTKSDNGIIAFDSIQITSKDVRAGGDGGAMFFSQVMDAILKFINEGKHEEAW